MRLLLFVLAACTSQTPSSDPTETTSTTTSTGTTITTLTTATTTTSTTTLTPISDVRNYIFGHSLLLHSDTANVPRWLNDFSAADGGSYEMSGQYGFADTHAGNLPPIAQWGVPGVPSAWDDGYGEEYGDIGFDTVLFTEANFRQYYPPTETDPDVNLPTSVDSTLAVFDWVEAAEPGTRFVVYENWPDMAGFVQSWPPTDLTDYHDYTTGEFHDWWLAYHDALQAERPGLDIRMIPVGPLLADLQTGVLSDLPPEALYEDDAPHGHPTLYFLAGLTTYMALYQRRAPANFPVPGDVDSRVADRYDQIVDEIWTELQADPRVW